MIAFMMGSYLAPVYGLFGLALYIRTFGDD